jgi:hypothetical protein
MSYNDKNNMALHCNCELCHSRYNLAYLIFYLLGMTTLLPWNFFITADDVSFCLHIIELLFNSCYVYL